MTTFIHSVLTVVLNALVLPFGLLFLVLPSDIVAQQNRRGTPTVHLITIATNTFYLPMDVIAVTCCSLLQSENAFFYNRCSRR
jgi:hypothetical protein